MAISRRLRFEILRRDDYTCRYCGAKAPDVPLTVDHVIPTTLGGGDEPSNLVTACQPCNAGKSSVPADADMVEQVENDALRWARAVELASERLEADLAEVDRQLSAFRDACGTWAEFLDGSWREKISTFLGLGLKPDQMASLFRYSITADHIPSSAVWRYFCGCCWRRVTELQEAARRLIESGEVQ